MSPTSLVPGLLLLAAAVPALEVQPVLPALTVGGYVSVIGSSSQISLRGGAQPGGGPIITSNPGGADSTNAYIGGAALDLVAPGSSPGGAYEGVASGFTVDAELRLGYAFSPRARAALDIRFDNTYSNDVCIQQARVDIDLSDRFALAAGKMESPLGWESPDRDGLWRINHGLASSLSGSEVQGAALAARLSEGSSVTIGLFNGLGLGAYRDDTNVNANGRLAAVADLKVDVPDVATIDFEAGYDPRSFDWGTSNDSGDWADVMQFGANTTVQLMRSYDALRVGAEVVYRRTGKAKPSITDGDAFDTLALSATANHRLPPELPGSVSIGYGKVMEGIAESTPMKQSTNEVFAAVLTKPGIDGLEMVGLNLEATYRWEDGAGGDGVRSNVWGAYIQLIAVIP